MNERREALELSNRGIAHAGAGDLSAALADFDAALSADPGFAQALNNRGFVRQLAGDAEGALADYTAAIALDSSVAAAYANRGSIRLAQWDLDGALSDLNAALDLDTRHCPAYVARANVRYHQRDLSAEADYRAAFALDPAYTARALIDLIVQALQRDRALLLADCGKHLSFEPGDFHSLARRGLVAILDGRDDEALPDLAEYRRLNPEGSPYLELLIAEAKRRRSAEAPPTLPTWLSACCPEPRP